MGQKDANYLSVATSALGRVMHLLQGPAMYSYVLCFPRVDRNIKLPRCHFSLEEHFVDIMLCSETIFFLN